MPHVVAQAVNWSRQHCSASLSCFDLMIWPSLVLSENFFTVVTSAAWTSKLFMNTRNSTGPSTDPWGTPDSTLCQLDILPFKPTHCFLFFNQVAIQFNSCPLSPCALSLFSILFRSTLLKALARILRPLPWSLFWRIRANRYCRPCGSSWVSAGVVHPWFSLISRLLLRTSSFFLRKIN